MPAGGALFGSSATGPGSTGGNKHLIEIRAGKMNLKGKTVYPDKRKGLLYIYQSDDSLMHFCWQDRTTGVVEDDLIIFPDDCDCVKVPQCTTGRVYLLRFKNNLRRFFFWLQEPRADKDEDNCKRINEYLNNPQGSVPQSGNSDQDLQSLLNNMSQSQLMQLFGGGQMGGLQSLLGTISNSRAPSTTPALTHRQTASAASQNTPSTPASTTVSTPTAPIVTTTPNAPRPNRNESPSAGESSTGATPSNPIQLSDLKNFLQKITPPAGSSSEQVDLSTALTSDALSSILSNTETLEQLQNHLPQTDANNVQEQLKSTLQSPQFQQAVSQFSSALVSGQLGPVVSQFGVTQEAIAAANEGNMQEFVKALEKESSTSTKDTGDSKDPAGKSTSKDDKKDDDEGMQLD